MLAVSPLRRHDDDTNRAAGGSQDVAAVVGDFSIGGKGIDFSEFYDGCLLDSIIDFDGIFVDGDVLPDLEVDPELLAEFSHSGGEESGACFLSVSVDRRPDECNDAGESGHRPRREEGGDKSYSSSRKAEEDASDRRDKSGVVDPAVTPRDGGKQRKPSSSAGHHSKNSNNPQGGKRKVKVDWTPELHRRFVQAVEQLGVDKAVPSRILEIMGIDCLTRHNVASHLQKYRSHRKHLLAREAEAASWNRRRHLYRGSCNKLRPNVAPAPNAALSTGPWLAALPTIGFPPPVASPHPVHPHFRPLHVWGHPSVDQSLAYIWPKHLPPHHSPIPPHRPSPGWLSGVAPHHGPWHPHQRVAAAAAAAAGGGGLTQGTPCYHPQIPLQPPTRFAAPQPPPFPGFHPLYKVDPHGSFFQPLPGQSPPAPPFDLHPSKETIDAALEDALTKPWLPLPLGLKPPSLDGVLGELHRQGVPDIPPPSSS
ncbi:hypothetical protein MLD38_030557 [Melastoma candidum]|uniref:Uncharacterized protein n=1 Tax=Melastoma candidum TaxID=119954 RepID=A0ACB9MP43_9MYRT|nr:hypothetical protein MLD38_030557 [Melastoma candidum]